jgi:hypothetical protein
MCSRHAHPRLGDHGCWFEFLAACRLAVPAAAAPVTCAVIRVQKTVAGAVFETSKTGPVNR